MLLETLSLNTSHYKVEDAGRLVVKVDSMNTSQTCSNCQKLTTKKLGLNIRFFNCSYCQYKNDRDINAALNILQLGKGLKQIK